mgnify:FL=1
MVTTMTDILPKGAIHSPFYCQRESGASTWGRNIIFVLQKPCSMAHLKKSIGPKWMLPLSTSDTFPSRRGKNPPLCLCAEGASFLFIWYYYQTRSGFWLFSQGYNHKDTKTQTRSRLIPRSRPTVTANAK